MSVYERGPPPDGSLFRLHDLCAACLPIGGVSIGRWDARESWRLDTSDGRQWTLADEANAPDDVKAAFEVFRAFDPWGTVDARHPAPEPPPAPDDAQPTLVAGRAEGDGADDPAGSDGGVVDDAVGAANYAPSVIIAGQTLTDQRKNEISTMIDLRAKDLKDPAQAVIQNTNIAELTNLIIMNLATDSDRAQEQLYRRVEAFVGQVDAVGAALKLSLSSMSLDQLDLFDVAAYPWPVWAA